MILPRHLHNITPIISILILAGALVFSGSCFIPVQNVAAQRIHLENEEHSRSDDRIENHFDIHESSIQEPTAQVENNFERMDVSVNLLLKQANNLYDNGNFTGA